jgi:homocysteine S-methyltransferase
MPDAILTRMASATNKQAALAAGLAIAQEMLAEVRGQVQGVQVSAPFGNFNAAAEVLGLGEDGAVNA